MIILPEFSLQMSCRRSMPRFARFGLNEFAPLRRGDKFPSRLSLKGQRSARAEMRRPGGGTRRRKRGWCRLPCVSPYRCEFQFELPFVFWFSLSPFVLPPLLTKEGWQPLRLTEWFSRRPYCVRFFCNVHEKVWRRSSLQMC